MKGVRLTFEHFLEVSNNIHGDRYSYDSLSFVDGKTKVKITCREHGDFMQIPGEHMRGRGCKECGDISRARKRKKTTEWFVEMSKRINGDRYDYSKTKYSGSRNLITITCKKHGDFMQIPTNHLAGWGCKLCANELLSHKNSKTTDWFIKKATEVHGDRYDYSMVKYHNKSKMVKIGCREHGYFIQEPQVHLNGSGCPSCCNGGFNRSIDGYLYALISSCGTMIKIGISNKYKNRIARLRGGTPFEFNLISVKSSSGSNIMALERYFHSKYESAGLSGFDGATEWLKYSPELMSEIMKKAP